MLINKKDHRIYVLLVFYDNFAMFVKLLTKNHDIWDNIKFESREGKGKGKEKPIRDHLEIKEAVHHPEDLALKRAAKLFSSRRFIIKKNKNKNKIKNKIKNKNKH